MNSLPSPGWLQTKTAHPLAEWTVDGTTGGAGSGLHSARDPGDVLGSRAFFSLYKVEFYRLTLGE